MATQARDNMYYLPPGIGHTLHHPRVVWPVRYVCAEPYRQP